MTIITVLGLYDTAASRLINCFILQSASILLHKRKHNIILPVLLYLLYYGIPLEKKKWNKNIFGKDLTTLYNT